MYVVVYNDIEGPSSIHILVLVIFRQINCASRAMLPFVITVLNDSNTILPNELLNAYFDHDSIIV